MIPPIVSTVPIMVTTKTGTPKIAAVIESCAESTESFTVKAAPSKAEASSIIVMPITFKTSIIIMLTFYTSILTKIRVDLL